MGAGVDGVHNHLGLKVFILVCYNVIILRNSMYSVYVLQYAYRQCQTLCWASLDCE